MKNLARNLFFVLAGILLYGDNSFGQTPKIARLKQKLDSLHGAAQSYTRDTTEINCLNSLSNNYLYINPDSAFLLADQALQIGVRSKNDAKMANSYMHIGNSYGVRGNYPLSVDYYLRALRIYERIGNKTGIEKMQGGLGVIYKREGDYQKALDYYFKALKTSEEVNNQNDIATHYGNIGVLYKTLAGIRGTTKRASDSLYKLALDYYFKGLKIDEGVKNLNAVGRHLGNIGSVYEKMNEFIKARDYFIKALEIDRGMKNNSSLTATLGDLGAIYTSCPSLSPPAGETKTGLALAEKYLMEALTTDQQMHQMDSERDDELRLSDLYKKMGKDGLALDHYKYAMVLKDSLFNIEKDKALTRKELGYEFDKKEALTKAQHDKEFAVAETDKKRQQLFLWLVIAVAGAVTIIALIILRTLRVTRKQKFVIEEQKKIVEEKQKEILDSIHYAKRIQQSILPTEKYFDKNLKRLNKK